MGYRWVRLDPRITPGWTHLGKSGSGSGKSGKTGKPEKLHMTYQIKALGKLVNVVALKIRISGFRIRKIRKNRKTGKITYDLSNLNSLKAG